LAETENTTENLSTALAGISIKARETIKRASILAGQLEKISLSLVIIKKEEAAIAPRVRYTIYRLTIFRV
jgi:hypothetical protein